MAAPLHRAPNTNCCVGVEAAARDGEHAMITIYIITMEGDGPTTLQEHNAADDE